MEMDPIENVHDPSKPVGRILQGDTAHEPVHLVSFAE
jgi:hypothetical protein